MGNARLLALILLGFLVFLPTPLPAATYTVTATTDPAVPDGSKCPADAVAAGCALRDALEAANADAVLDQISFLISGSGVHTIALSDVLTVMNPVVIDGYSQAGAAANTIAQAGSTAVLVIELTRGIVILASGSTVRGLVVNDPSAAIVLGGNDNTIAGNFLGTNATATDTPGTTGAGVAVSGDDNVIGGTTPADRNIISGTQQGISISSGGTGTLIVGNFIGTDVGGTAAITNWIDGVYVDYFVSGIQIGGTDSSARNVVSGNGTGLHLMSVNQCVVEGNYVGTDALGVSALPNSADGVLIGGLSINNRVGGRVDGAGNLIAFNHGNGVTVTGSSTNILIAENRIRENDLLGIDLGASGSADGVTANDAADFDSGANDLMNFPTIDSAISENAETVVSGTLESVADADVTIEVFTAENCDHGAGQALGFIGSKTLVTDGVGHATYTLTAPVGFQADTPLVATATLDYYVGMSFQSTSEFSACANVVYIAHCGNGLQEDAEECDDGNTDNGDGCSDACAVEPGTLPTGGGSGSSSGGSPGNGQSASGGSSGGQSSGGAQSTGGLSSTKTASGCRCHGAGGGEFTALLLVALGLASQKRRRK